MKKIERFLKKIYKPKLRPEKRRKLLLLSIVIFLAVMITTLSQYYLVWTNNGIYYLCFLFGIMSLVGVLVARYGNDFWVALIYGEGSV